MTPAARRPKALVEWDRWQTLDRYEFRDEPPPQGALRGVRDHSPYEIVTFLVRNHCQLSALEATS